MNNKATPAPPQFTSTPQVFTAIRYLQISSLTKSVACSFSKQRGCKLDAQQDPHSLSGMLYTLSLHILASLMHNITVNQPVRTFAFTKASFPPDKYCKCVSFAEYKPTLVQTLYSQSLSISCIICRFRMTTYYMHQT